MSSLVLGRTSQLTVRRFEIFYFCALISKVTKGTATGFTLAVYICAQ